MGERDGHGQGTFSWTDLTTPDAQGAKEFYGGLFGWDYADNPIPDGGVYVIATLGGRAAAAMFETTERHPAWASYVTVDDVDASTAKAGELGANVLAERSTSWTPGACRRSRTRRAPCSASGSRARASVPRS
jgi:uncharacterized protein